MALGSFVSSLGGIFGKKPEVPGYPTEDMKKIAEQQRQETQKLAAMFPQRAYQQTGTYQSSIDQAKKEAQDRAREQAGGFLESLDPLTSRIYQAQADQLKRSIYGAIPETVQAAREAGAAGGGLQRGVVQSQLAGIPVQAAQQYATGLESLNIESLKAKQDALAKVYDADTQMGLKLLGIDENTALNILNTGSQADVNELNTLLDEAKNYAQNQRSIQAGQYENAIAQALQSAINEQTKWENIGTAIDSGQQVANQMVQAALSGQSGGTGGGTDIASLITSIMGGRNKKGSTPGQNSALAGWGA